jgi:hypothetical protein
MHRACIFLRNYRLFEQGDYDSSALELNHAVSLYESNPGSRQEADKLLKSISFIRLSYSILNELILQEKFDEAEDKADEIVRECRGDKEAQKLVASARKKHNLQLAESSYQDALRYREIGDLRNALTKVESALFLDPGHTGAKHLRKELKDRQDRFDNVTVVIIVILFLSLITIALILI